MLRNFRTYQLALKLYEECQRIKPKSAIIKDQFERATLSIVLNIAEGSGKTTIRDRRKFYSIAMGSLRETQALVMILKDEERTLPQLADQLAASLYRLMQNPGGA